MTLDVAPPDPPELESQLDAEEYDDVNVKVDDYRRDELGEFLEAGAWAEAFENWAARTEMDEETFDICTDLRLFAEFDFFWDDFADRVGYHAPGLPEDWKERELDRKSVV